MTSPNLTPSFTRNLTLFLTAALMPLTQAEPLTYPEARRDPLTETLHGRDIADPYRWLEELDSKETKQWITDQIKLANTWLEDAPDRDAIRDRLTELWDYDKYGVPRKVADRLFYTKQTGLQNQGVLYWQPDAPNAETTVLLDPNKLAEDGTAALAGWDVSPDGKHLAYGIAIAGSDWEEWFVREIDSGQNLQDHVEWVKFSSPSWSRDSKGFYYARYDAPPAGEELEATNYFHKLYFHRLGTTQSEDILVYERPDQKEWGFDAFETEDAHYLIINIWRGSTEENAVFYKDLFAGPDAEVIELFADFDADYRFIGNDESLFYFQTNNNAPLSRLVAVDITKPDPDHWREIIPESENRLETLSLFGDTLIAQYYVDVVTKVERFDLDGKKLGDIKLSTLGSVYGFGGERADTETFYYLTGFTDPGTIYRYDIPDDRSTLFRASEVDFDPADFVTRQVFFKSQDGTRIPMFISHRKDLTFEQPAPTYLYAYGGFNVSLTPRFSLANLVWMERGGVFAQPNLRGGGEYGKDWHEAGMLDKKQNVFDDFIAAAEYLITKGITSPDKLAIGGGSNGGLLIGAVINQRPELFGAAVAQVGVFDMLRFQKYTIGWAWMPEYGDPDVAEEFETLMSYSPYHNTQTDHPYPPTLITTADHDDRVFPAHSFKFGAALQHAQSGHNPILMRIETKAGHGAGKPTSKSIDEIVDRWSFLNKALKLSSP
jgi:prolyl oligopeptidase